MNVIKSKNISDHQRGILRWAYGKIERVYSQLSVEYIEDDDIKAALDHLLKAIK